MIFNDADHWNCLHPDLEPIDPDQDGDLRRLLEWINKLLDSNSTRVVGE